MPITRKEIEAQYEVVDGFIATAGKFEGEPVYSPYFYDKMMAGLGEYLEDKTYHLTIMPEDLSEFPQLAGYTEIYLDIYEDGSIICLVDGECTNHNQVEDVDDPDEPDYGALGDIPPGTDSRP
jgi:hypothetical protein